MPRLVLYLEPDAADQLKAIAQRERRDYRTQAALIVEHELAKLKEAQVSETTTR